MSDTLKTFGERIRELREQQGLTQEQLASKVKISRTYLSQIEQGKATNLSLRLAEDLKRVLDLDTPIPVLQQNVNVDSALRALAEEEGIPEGQVLALASLQYRGKRPTTKAQWKLLYNLIKASLENID